MRLILIANGAHKALSRYGEERQAHLARCSGGLRCGNHNAIFKGSAHCHSSAGNGIVEITAGVVGCRFKPQFGVALWSASSLVALPLIGAIHAGGRIGGLHLIASHKHRVAGHGYIAYGEQFVLVGLRTCARGAHLEEFVLGHGIEAVNPWLLLGIECKHIHRVALGKLAAYGLVGKHIHALMRIVAAHFIRACQFEPLFLQRVGIVVGGIGHISFGFHLHYGIGGFAGCNGVVYGFSAILFIEFAQGLIARCFHLEGVVGTGLKVFEHKHAVILIVGGVFCHFHAALVEGDYGIVDGQILIVRCGVGVIVSMRKDGVQILHRTHHITCVFGIPTKPCSHASGIAKAFLTAVVGIECAMACRLIGVAIAFGKKSVAGVAAKHAEVAGGIFCVLRGILITVVECQVAHDARRGARQHIYAVRLENGPQGLCHGATCLLILERTRTFPHILIVGCRCGIAVVDEQREVGAAAIGGCIGVNGEEIVGVEGITLFRYLREVAIIFLGVGCSRYIGIRAVFHARIHNVLLRHAPFFEYGSHLQTFPKVGVRFIEAGGVACSVIDGGKVAVVGTPTAVAGIDVDSCLCLGECTAGKCYHHCGYDCDYCQYYSFHHFHSAMLFKVDNIGFAFIGAEHYFSCFGAGIGIHCLHARVG